MREFNHRITDADVERVVRRDFWTDQWEAVLILLREPVTVDAEPVPGYARWSFRHHHRQLLLQSGEQLLWVRLPRFQAALVKVSGGNFERLVECLKLDAGEVVNAAENPNFSTKPRPRDATVSEAKQWCVDMGPLRNADWDQYRKWLDRPTKVRTDDGV